jgi:hypothetical protein
MPSYRPKKGETVCVKFKTKWNNTRNKKKGSPKPIELVGTVLDPKTGKTKFTDDEIVNIIYSKKGLEWLNETELTKSVATSLQNMSKAKALGKTRRKSKPKPRKSKPRKSKPKKTIRIKQKGGV